MASISLIEHSITVEDVRWNLPPSRLYEETIRHDHDSRIAESGALVAYSGAKTGRSPKDNLVVRHPGSENDVLWGSVNIPLDHRVKVRGIFNIEGSCDAKTVDLANESEPDFLLARRTRSRRRTYLRIEGFVCPKASAGYREGPPCRSASSLSASSNSFASMRSAAVRPVGSSFNRHTRPCFVSRVNSRELRCGLPPCPSRGSMCFISWRIAYTSCGSSVWPGGSSNLNRIEGRPPPSRSVYRRYRMAPVYLSVHGRAWRLALGLRPRSSLSDLPSIALLAPLKQAVSQIR